jgi:hypothetical protein
MIVDTNLLVYATFVDAPEHVRVRERLETALAHDHGFRRFSRIRVFDPLTSRST